MKLYPLRKRRAVDLEELIRVRSRPASFPYITGDGFRAAASLVCDESGLAGIWTSGGMVFCAPSHAHTLIKTIQEQNLESRTQEMTLVIHNGDQIPTKGIFIEMLRMFSQVWSINLTFELTKLGVRPIPVGLENLHWKRNGELKYFDLPHLSGLHTPASQRTNLILGSFRIETNQEIREPLREKLIAAKGIWKEPTASPNDYFNLVRSSTFVISPPGNGLDCHRTWEAIYLGAIPIVLGGTLPPELITQLPICEVSSWDDILMNDELELRNIASELEKIPTSMAYLPYWLKMCS